MTGVQTCALPIYHVIDILRVMPGNQILLDHFLGGAIEAEADAICDRSEERRVGKECRSRWSPYH